MSKEGLNEAIIAEYDGTTTIMADPDALEQIKNAAETAQAAKEGTCKIVLSDPLSGAKFTLLFRRAFYSHANDEDKVVRF